MSWDDEAYERDDPKSEGWVERLLDRHEIREGDNDVHNR